MDEPHFNLIDAAWIPVLDRAGASREVSLREVFRQADELVAITGELPTVSFALLRVMLAVLHRAIEGPTDALHWSETRNDWATVVEDVEGYLVDYYDRFWMRHPTHPFMQVASLRGCNPNTSVKPISQLIVDGTGSENKAALFSTRTEDSIRGIGWGEAARWLVHLHAYDIAGNHTGAVGDPRVMGGKGPGIGTGWAGQFGGVHLVGTSMRETLLLNLLPIARGTSGVEVDAEGDLPVWERPPLTALPETWATGDGSKRAYRGPTGPADVYTWPARRVLLWGSDAVVTGLVNCQGDRAQSGRTPPENWMRVEPMSAWCLSAARSKAAGGRSIYYPHKHDPNKAFWRGLSALLPHRTGRSHSGGEPDRTIPPALAKWAGRLCASENGLGPIQTWQAVGMVYGPNASSFHEVIDDRLMLPAALFADHTLAQEAVDAVEAAESAVSTLGTLAQDVALAAGGSPKSGSPDASVGVLASR